MRSAQARPATAICPRTGSRVFIREELLELTEPIEVVCPACDRWHIWDPATLTLKEPNSARGNSAAQDARCAGGEDDSS